MKTRQKNFTEKQVLIFCLFVMLVIYAIFMSAEYLVVYNQVLYCQEILHNSTNVLNNCVDALTFTVDACIEAIQ